jgi:hypothetical protein
VAGTGGVIPDAVRYYLPLEKTYFNSDDTQQILFFSSPKVGLAPLGVRVRVL